MILYRVISSDEFINLRANSLKIRNKRNQYSLDDNTFVYEPGVEYMHFFRYAGHAEMNKKNFGVQIIKVNIPDDLIEQHGFGFYWCCEDNIRNVVPLPECIIKRENFDVKFIENFNYECDLNNPMALDGIYNQLYLKLLLDFEKQYNCSDKKEELTFYNYVAWILRDKDLEQILLSNYLNEKNRTNDNKPNLLIKKKACF